MVCARMRQFFNTLLVNSRRSSSEAVVVVLGVGDVEGVYGSVVYRSGIRGCDRSSDFRFHLFLVNTGVIFPGCVLYWVTDLHCTINQFSHI